VGRYTAQKSVIGLEQAQQLHSLLLFKGWGQNQAHALNMVDVAT